MHFKQNLDTRTQPKVWEYGWNIIVTPILIPKGDWGRGGGGVREAITNICIYSSQTELPGSVG